MYTRKFTDHRGLSKTKKYVARTTPDVVTRNFDALVESGQGEYKAWRSRWRDNMNIKHGTYGETDISLFEDFERQELLVELHWRPRGVRS